VNFHVCIHALKRTKFLDKSYDHHINFLRTLRKPIDIDPSMFQAHLAFHNMRLTELSGVPSTDTEAQLSPSELRQIFLHAMPLTW
jgi:hypothetical protein